MAGPEGVCTHSVIYSRFRNVLKNCLELISFRGNKVAKEGYLCSLNVA